MKNAILAFLVTVTAAGAELIPEMLTLTFDRTNETAIVSSTPYIDGSTLVLTNCRALLLPVGASPAAPQDLTDCGLILYVGNSETSTVFYATVQDATNGTFTATITLPAITSPAAVGYGTDGATYAGIALAITNGPARIDYRDEKRVYLRQRLK